MKKYILLPLFLLSLNLYAIEDSTRGQHFEKKTIYPEVLNYVLKKTFNLSWLKYDIAEGVGGEKFLINQQNGGKQNTSYARKLESPFEEPLYVNYIGGMDYDTKINRERNTNVVSNLIHQQFSRHYCSQLIYMNIVDFDEVDLDNTDFKELGRSEDGRKDTAFLHLLGSRSLGGTSSKLTDSRYSEKIINPEWSPNNSEQMAHIEHYLKLMHIILKGVPINKSQFEMATNVFNDIYGLLNSSDEARTNFQDSLGTNHVLNDENKKLNPDRVYAGYVGVPVLEINSFVNENVAGTIYGNNDSNSAGYYKWLPWIGVCNFMLLIDGGLVKY